MSIKVNARQTLQNVGSAKGSYRYVLQTELYNRLSATKVLKEAALRSGIPQGSMTACWQAIGDVIKAWATEGHSVAVPGLGSMRFSVRAQSVENAEDVGTDLIKSRRVIFVPSVDIKDELKRTSINITCIDKDGNVVKQVTSHDSGDVEDADNNTDNGVDNAGDGNNAGGGNGGVTPITPVGNGGDNGGGTGGNTGGGDDGGGSDEPTED